MRRARTVRTKAGIFLLALLLLLGLIVALMTSLQTQLLFPTGAVPAAGPLPPAARQLTLDAPQATLGGVHIPAAEPSSDRLLVLGFGGNAWNGSDVAVELHRIFPQADVVVFHYRGYAPSGGTPSAEALLDDAPLVFDEARRLVRPDRIVAVGFSIGSGVAASLASRRPLNGMILVTPFDSLKAVARDLYPWLPSMFLEHEMDAAASLSEADVPVAIVAAAEDEIIPAERTEALRLRARNLVFDRTISGAEHNDLYAREAFHRAMIDALEALASRAAI